jgi:hypothetical protein
MRQAFSSLASQRFQLLDIQGLESVSSPSGRRLAYALIFEE